MPNGLRDSLIALSSACVLALTIIVPAVGRLIAAAIDRHADATREAHGLPGRHPFDDGNHRHGAKKPTAK